MSWLEDYKKLLSFKSISAESEHQQDLVQCLKWIQAYVEAIGFKTEVWETEGHPVLFASWLQAPGKETLLIYNHYDVQPVDPLELWKTPPFEPTVRDNTIYARGAQDNKGQLFYTLLALKSLWEKKGAFPLNLKLIIEGEEEIGSLHLPPVLKKHASQLQADHLAIVDCGIPGPGTPAVSLGVRGIVTLEIEVKGTETDLHSGSHGGLAYNPIFALVEILASAKDPYGKVAIPGFYDDIEELSEEEKKSLSFDFNEEQYKREFGAHPTGGERHLHPLERNWLRPTFEVNGIIGGYTGKGFKTVIPAKASAKISCRLVRGQDPEKIGPLVASFLKAHRRPGFDVTVHLHAGSGPAVLSSPLSPTVQAFAKAFTATFNKPCQYTLEGGSIPIVSSLQKASRAPVVLVGLALPSDQIHAPNEHFSLDRIEKGREIMILAIENLALG